MPRPKKKRTIANPPVVEGFKPFGVPITDLKPIILLYEEYESIRLVDYEDLSQDQASEQMDVSRPTSTRIHDKAIKSIAQTFMKGKAIFTEGGNCHSDKYWYRCGDCLRLNISDIETENCTCCGSENLKQLNEMDTNKAADACVCIHCGIEIQHEKGMPCRNNDCPPSVERKWSGKEVITINHISKNNKKMKVAAPTKGTTIDDHFGHCDSYTIFNVNNKNEIESTEILPSANGCGCKSNIASTLQNLGVSILIAGSMGDGAMNVLNKHGIRVLRGNSGDAEAIVKEFLNGGISDSGIACMHHGDDAHTCSH